MGLSKLHLRARLRSVITCLAVFTCSVSVAVASTWINASGGLYTTAGNWSGGVPNGQGAIADFTTLDVNGDISVQLDSDVTLGELAFGDTGLGSAASWELWTNASPFPVITLDNGASKPIIRVNTMTPTEFDDTFIAHSLAGTNGFVKLGGGIATLGELTANTITGGIDINEGTLRVRSALPSQAITIADGATLDTNQEMRFGAGINVASGATANIIANSNIGNISAAGATLNLFTPSTISGNDNWAVNGSPAAVNVSSTSESGGFFRLRVNGGGFNSTESLADTAVHLDNITMWTRTNSGGNTVNIGSLSGTANAALSGGADSGGTVARYFIGSLNTDTEFAGNIDSNLITNLPASLNLSKVGTGTLTLSGFLNYQPSLTGNGASNSSLRGGITTVEAGTLALKNSAAIPGGLAGTEAGDLYTTVDVRAGATLDVSGYTAGTYSTAALQQVIGAGTVKGNYSHDEGIIRPANTLTGTNPVSVAVGGTITFDGNFTWNGGVLDFDLTDDPADGNDLVNVTGTTTLTSGVITPHFLGELPSAGTYTVLTSAGGISGSAANISVEWPGRGTNPVPFISGNSLQFIASDVNEGGTMTWRGNHATNPTYWDVETTPNWTGANPNTFFQNDVVQFTDAATGFNVEIQETVLPTAVVFNNVTNDYTVSGLSGISGPTGLTKTGAGKLTITTTNTFTGTANLSGGGTVDVGGAGSALGVGPLVMNGVTLLGSTGAPSLANPTLQVSGTNTIQADGNLGSGAIFNVPALSGSGNLTITSTVGDPVVDPPSGNGKWFALNATNNFSGTLNLTGPTSTPEAPVQGLTVRTTTTNGGTQLGAATVNMSNASMANRQGGSGDYTFTIGALNGDENSNLLGFVGGSGGRYNVIWEIGALNTDSEFAGGITDPGGTNGTSGVFAWQDRSNDSTVNPVFEQIAISHLRKVGSGKLTLTGLSGVTGTGFNADGSEQVVSDTYSGNTYIEGGILSTTTPYLADFSDVFISSGAVFDLSFTGEDVIDSLYLGNTPQNPGTYGAIGSGATFQSAFFTGSGILNVTTLGEPITTPGDFDGDGDVDGRDFLAWQRGQSPNALSAGDLALWQDNYGGGNQLVASATAVPEPSTALLIVACGLGLFGLRKRA